MDNATIIFGLLAAFVVWKLWSVLGSNHQVGTANKDTISPKFEPSSSQPSPEAQRSSSDDGSRWSPFARSGKDLADILDYIVQNDTNFKPETFVEGAKAAYEMIIAALSNGEITSIRTLLSNHVNQEFSQELQRLHAMGQFQRTIVVSLDNAQIDQAVCHGDVARLTIVFRAKLIAYMDDSNGTVISGDKAKIFTAEDIWAFEKKVTDPNPNWILVNTQDSR